MKNFVNRGHDIYFLGRNRGKNSPSTISLKISPLMGREYYSVAVSLNEHTLDFMARSLHSKFFQNTKIVATRRNSTENVHTRTKRKIEKFEYESKKNVESNIFTLSPKTRLSRSFFSVAMS